MVTYIVADIQAKLRELYGPSHYYTTRYSVEEMSYCGKVPEWMEAFIPHLGRSDSVLDVGPGYGTLACLAAQLSPAQVITLDRLTLISDEVARIYGLNRKIGDIERFLTNPVLGEGFSAVIMTEVLEHFNFHPLPTLRYVNSIMKPGGRLFLSTPDALTWSGGYLEMLGSLVPFDPICNDYTHPAWRDCHVHQYTKGELVGLLDMAGFRVDKYATSTSHGGNHHIIECGVDR